ncbi:hypothetical protein ACXR0O_28215 [Verrucomicrobiota bacterium sgz303538]
MKSTLSSIVAFVAMAVTVAATPSLRIDTTITRADKIYNRPTLFVSSGEQASITSGDKDTALTYAVTPTLLDNGTVGIQTVITQRNGKKTNKFATSRIVVPLGKSVTLRCGELLINAKPSLAK